ncbi:MAG: ATP-binding protein [Muribaculaceae bacterium]|nr:ATP-binding protein [Muribaculaceae bacterium]
MKREIESKLIAWKNSTHRKPLIVMGARQVGKTYLLQQFGKNHYEHLAYINCDNNPQVANLFAEGYDIERILLAIGAITKVPIIAGKTLIVLDEIQELRHGLTALKYFCELAPQHHVAVAGSLLGITMHHGASAPVGKVDIINMYPLTYTEFLLAIGQERLLQILKSKDWRTIQMLKLEFIKYLRIYYFVGGMPEAVLKYIETNDAMSVRNVQNNILAIYRSDMSKHASPQEVVRITQVWQSIPSQLARENKKFIYGAIKSGARAREFELAIQWLQDAGLVIRVNRASKANLPLKFYENLSAFKLYMLDTGMLGALGNVPPEQLLTKDNELSGIKGAFTENYVVSQIITMRDVTICYYSNENHTLEIDMLLQERSNIWPIEIKAEENLRSKSLRTFVNDNPELIGLRFSMSDYRDQQWMRNIPLYACTTYFLND